MFRAPPGWRQSLLPRPGPVLGRGSGLLFLEGVLQEAPRVFQFGSRGAVVTQNHSHHRAPFNV